MFEYLEVLVLMNFAAVLVAAVVSIPAAFVARAFRRWSSDESEASSIKLSMVLMALIYSSLNASIAHVWTDAQQIARTWPYGLCGFLFTHLALNANLHSRRQSYRESWFPDGGTEASVVGAGYGMVAGVIAYPVFYLYPGIMTSIPGAELFFALVGSACAWLIGFWVVRLLLGLVTIWFLLGAAQIYFTVALMLALFVFAWRRRTSAEARTVEVQTDAISPQSERVSSGISADSEARREEDKGEFKVVDRRRFIP